MGKPIDDLFPKMRVGLDAFVGFRLTEPLPAPGGVAGKGQAAAATVVHADQDRFFIAGAFCQHRGAGFFAPQASHSIQLGQPTPQLLVRIWVFREAHQVMAQTFVRRLNLNLGIRLTGSV